MNIFTSTIKEGQREVSNGTCGKSRKGSTKWTHKGTLPNHKIDQWPKNTTMATVKDANGNTIFDKEAQNKRWMEHFEGFLNRPPPNNPPDILPARKDLPICCEPPAREEIAKAAKQLHANKAAGPDAILPEALKIYIDVSKDILYDLFVKIWKEEQFPKDWKEGHLVKLPKKGDLGNCNNYRGITLLSIPGEVFNKVILNRIKDAVDNILRDEQAGFWKNRSCSDQIAALRIIIEQSHEWKSPLIINFIDYEKAFDSIDRATLWKIMRHYGIPQKLVTLVEKMYDGTTCRILNEGQLTDSFEIKTGVKQGCLLSPFLFILALDWLLKEVTRGKRNGIQWTLLSHNHDQMQDKTKLLRDTSQTIGLRIHPGK